MLKLRALLLLCVAFPAQAGLFTDDEAHKLIQQLESRLAKLEADSKHLEGAAEQQIKATLDLQGQIEAQNAELRKLRGQNEELTHGLQDAEKRTKDFYVDLDARLRRLETALETVKEAAKETAKEAAKETAKEAAKETAKEVAKEAAKEAVKEAINANPPVAKTVDSDLGPENRAIETAYNLFKASNHEKGVAALQEFVKTYPDSAHIPNAKYWLGSMLFTLRNYKAALDNFQELLSISPTYVKAPDVMFNVAGCQQELKQNPAAKKTLKQLVARYPNSDAAIKANQLLSK